MEGLSWLEYLMPHAHCLSPAPGLVPTFAATALVTGLAYLLIPYAIFRFRRARPDVLPRPVARLFAAFIGLCGLGHLLLVGGLYQGGLWYVARALVNVMTSGVSVAAALFVLLNWREAAELLPNVQETLRTARRFQAAFHDSMAAKTLVDHAGYFVEPNAAFCRLTGYARVELQRMTYMDLTHPEDVEIDMAMARDVSDGHSRGYKLRKRYLRRNGEIYWVDLYVSPIAGETDLFEMYMAEVRDVSPEVEAREAVEENYKQLKKTLQTIETVLGERLDAHYGKPDGNGA